NVEGRQVPSELSTCHDVDRLEEGKHRAVMKIRGSNGHIAQAGDAEHMPVALDARDGEAAKVRGSDARPLGEWIGEYPKLLKEISSKIHTLVTSDTSVRFEQFVATFLVGRNGIGLPA